MNFDYTEAYRTMYLIRHTEEEIARRYHPADLMRCPTHLSIGQESAGVGVLMALSPEDHVYSSHRSHAHFLGKGGNLNAMIVNRRLWSRRTPADVVVMRVGGALYGDAHLELSSYPREAVGRVLRETQQWYDATKGGG